MPRRPAPAARALLVLDPQGQRQDGEPGAEPRTGAEYRPWLEAEKRLRALVYELEELSLSVLDGDPRSPHRPPAAKKVFPPVETRDPQPLILWPGLHLVLKRLTSGPNVKTSPDTITSTSTFPTQAAYRFWKQLRSPEPAPTNFGVLHDETGRVR
jgi:hypothetical protein